MEWRHCTIRASGLLAVVHFSSFGGTDRVGSRTRTVRITFERTRTNVVYFKHSSYFKHSGFVNGNSPHYTTGGVTGCHWYKSSPLNGRSKKRNYHGRTTKTCALYVILVLSGAPNFPTAVALYCIDRSQPRLEGPLTNSHHLLHATVALPKIVSHSCFPGTLKSSSYYY